MLTWKGTLSQELLGFPWPLEGWGACSADVAGADVAAPPRAALAAVYACLHPLSSPHWRQLSLGVSLGVRVHAALGVASVVPCVIVTVPVSVTVTAPVTAIVAETVTASVTVTVRATVAAVVTALATLHDSFCGPGGRGQDCT